MDPKWLIVKVMARKGCSDWAHRCCFTPLAIALGAIELTDLCALAFKVG